MPKTLIITREQVRGLLTMAVALEAVEEAFREYGEGRVQMPPKPYLTFENGDLRCMPAYLPDFHVASVKNVNVHPGNTDLPTVMATLTVIDPDTGFPTAIMDATWLTAMRTGAAGGIAAKYLARPDSRVAAFVGAGRQAMAQLASLVQTLPAIAEILVHDRDSERAAAFAAQTSKAFGLRAEACDLERAVREADVLTTVTPSREPFVMRDELSEGVHINAIGADAPGKQELEACVLLDGKVVVDNWEQASHGGEINVAVASGALTRSSIHADIGEVVTGRRPGRESEQEITVFDSTGLAIQDCACAARVLDLVRESGKELTTVDFLG